jgi:hypothetical protein
MEIFSQMHVPPGESGHERFLREADAAITAAGSGSRFDGGPAHGATRLREAALAARVA